MPRSRNLYTNKSDRDKPFKLSRSKVDLFLECRRCFYIDRKKGTGRPPSFPFNLNNAVDQLLKDEFDIYRYKKKRHPYMIENNINAIPHTHELLDEWRANFRGVQYLDRSTNLLLHGAIDDLWIDLDTNQLIVVDYKATSKKEEVSLDANWQISYKRQVEFYQWLLKMNEEDISDVAYFVYLNGLKEDLLFDNKLTFKVKVISYEGNTGWIPSVISRIFEVLENDELPDSSIGCKYCIYVNEFVSA